MFQQRSIRFKLVAGFGSLLALVSILIIIATYSIESALNTGDSLVNQSIHQVELGRQLLGAVRAVDDNMWNTVYNAPQTVSTFVPQHQSDVQIANNYEKNLRHTTLPTSTTQILGQYDAVWSVYLQNSDKELQLLEQNNVNDAQTLYNTNYNDEIQKAFGQLDSFILKIEANTNQILRSADTFSNNSIILAAIIGIVIVCAGIVIAWLLSQEIVVGTHRLKNIAIEIADHGNLAVGMQAEAATKNPGNNEMRHLAAGFSQMSLKLTNIFERIHADSATVGSMTETLSLHSKQTTLATNEVAHTIEHVAVGTEQQTQQIQDISRDIEHLLEQIKVLQDGSQQSTGSMQILEEKFTVIAERIHKLGMRTGEIEVIVETVGKIAE